MQAFAYFPSVVYREEYPELVEQTIAASEKHYEFIKTQIPDADKRHTIQTASMLEDVEMDELKNCFYQTGVSILKDQGYIIDNYDFYISSMWGHEVLEYGGNETHVHKNSQICGFYFFETPENGAAILFKDPRHTKEMVELDPYPSQDILVSTNTIHFSNLMPGTFLFCNAWLPHQILGRGAQERSRFIHFILGYKEKNK